jgi:hypothetical protein
MKVRSGFVSNSSSSSFILLGVKTEDENYQSMCEKYLPKDVLEKGIEHWNEYFKKNNYTDCKIDYSDIWYENLDNICGDFDVVSDDGPTYFGKRLADTEYELPNGSISLEDFDEMKEKLKEKFPDKEVKLYFGTRAC